MQLEEHLRDVPKGTHQRDEYFALGIREVATGIAFLNNAVGLVHGAIGLSSIVVTVRERERESKFFADCE